MKGLKLLIMGMFDGEKGVNLFLVGLKLKGLEVIRGFVKLS